MCTVAKLLAQSILCFVSDCRVTTAALYVKGVSPAAFGALQELAKRNCVLLCKHGTPPYCVDLFSAFGGPFRIILIILFSSEDPPTVHFCRDLRKKGLLQKTIDVCNSPI